MILVDTSVLIDYFKGIENETSIKFDTVLDRHIPYGINDFIYLEILQGTRNKRDFTRLKHYLDTVKSYQLTSGRKSYAQAAMIYQLCRRKGITISSSVDLLIVQTAIENNLVLLHNDRDFLQIQKVVHNLEFL